MESCFARHKGANDWELLQHLRRAGAQAFRPAEPGPGLTKRQAEGAHQGGRHLREGAWENGCQGAASGRPQPQGAAGSGKEAP